LRSIAFRGIFSFGSPSTLTCEPAPSGVRVSVDLTNIYEESGMDLTGCAVSGPPGNVVMQLYDVLQGY